MLKAIGNRIGRIRKSRDLTQANMAEELGMTTSAYSKIERGDTNIPLNRLLQIAKALNVEVTEFFTESATMMASDSETLYGFASREEVERLSRLVKTLSNEIEKLRGELKGAKRKKAKKGN